MIFASSGSVGLIVVLVILGFIFLKIYKKMKRLKLDAVTMINGGVKCGKTTLALYLAYKKYRSNVFRYHVRTFFQKLFKRKLDEKPLFYSNIPVGFDFVPLTYDLVLRKKVRFAYKSVIFISESSLFAGSMDFNSEYVNEKMTAFVKLIGHETRGGSLFVETQSLNDNHYSFKRGINRYVWIQSLVKVIPFFMKYNVREMFYADGDNSVTNVFNTDVDENTKSIFVSKRIWKKFDSFCYSGLTDDLPVYDDVVHGADLKDLKARNVLRIKYSEDFLKSLNEKKRKELMEVKNEI